MPTLADVIESHLKKLMARAGENVIEIRRCDVAQRFDCVPSQINYVLETRFTPQRGYYVESRRGGGGYIRIAHVTVRRGIDTLQAVFNEIGSRISADSADQILDRLQEVGLLNKMDGAVVRGVLKEETEGIESPLAEVIRAKLLRAMLRFVLRAPNSRRKAAEME